MATVKHFEVQPLSMVTKEGLQRVDFLYQSSKPIHLLLSVYRGEQAVVENIPVAFNGGKGKATLFLPKQDESFDAVWKLTDKNANEEASVLREWTKPRERTMFVMVASHTDIGLHNSQYIQRYNSCRFLDMAKKLCDETDSRDVNDRYRYTMEGTWFWNNYGMDRGREAAEAVVRDYLKTGKLGYCCGIAGNHTQVFGLEEMCRSTYEKRRLKDNWDLDSETMAMIDINGMTMSMIQPYAEAGIKNIIFAPNHWNPLPSTVWKQDLSKEGVTLNPDASGGGSRVDVRYESDLPMVFNWEDENGNRILVWASTQYGYGGASIGLFPNNRYDWDTVMKMEERMANHLPLLDEKYPYDVWLLACYDDDQEPNMEVTNSIQGWNEKWEWPKLRTLGDTGEPFRILREKHGDQIPVLRGDMTGGWYQHPLTTPELLAQKFEVDRLLPTAEKWSTVAALLDETYQYPATDFRRAWDYLLFNDEHSYGTSGYQGRKVYETWMQHRDWIEKAQATAESENAAALAVIAGKIPSENGSVVVFNPTSLNRRELVELPDECSAVLDIPPFGYKAVCADTFAANNGRFEKMKEPPVIENAFYRVSFAENGSMASIFDKEQNRELLDTKNRFRANEMVYTNDNHKTFLVPEKAEFEILTETAKTTVFVKTREQTLGTEMEQVITLPNHEKRIDIDNRMYHVKDMINRRRYIRYIYYAFPFAVDNCRRYCHLNGAVAEYAKDVTGHGTDVYMAVNEWCCAENEKHGVALLTLDSQLMEFDHIHPDKTDFANTGDGAQMFAYVANDWLQMHTPGRSHLDYRFRYSITSYSGTYQAAKIPQMAERYANPVQLTWISKQEGTLDADAHSFMQTAQRLIGFKRADDGNGIIARLYGDAENTQFRMNFGREWKVERVRIDETALSENESVGKTGFATYRIGGDAISLIERPVVQKRGENGAPAPIGSVYTGLITSPRAAAGENDGHLYLLWGHSTEKDFSHYKLYRSEHSGFVADDTTFVADVMPEEYCVGRYVDTGLKNHAPYYYRVCAVNKAGICGELSEEFCGITKEDR